MNSARKSSSQRNSLSSIRWRYVFSALVGMARCAVPARVVAGGTNIYATVAIEGVAPLHAARTSQREVPTALNRYQWGRGPGRGGRSCEDSALLAPLRAPASRGEEEEA